MEKVLWDIKEMVFNLGYTGEYLTGAHDGKDHEILEAISARKAQFEAFLE
jgi:hypothetical protein